MLVPEVPDLAPPLPIWDHLVTMATVGVPDWFPFGVPVDPRYQIPILNAPSIDRLPRDATAFDKRGQARDLATTLLHFYVQDRKLASQARRPQQFVASFASAWGVTSPDYSMWAEGPEHLRILAVHLNRMVGAYFQSRGLRVIPSLRWIDHRDYDYAFIGVEVGSAVSVSTHGLWRAGELRQGFLNGLHEALDRLNPPVVFVHGTVNHLVFRDIARKTELIHLADDRTRTQRKVA